MGCVGKGGGEGGRAWGATVNDRKERTKNAKATTSERVGCLCVYACLCYCFLFVIGVGSCIHAPGRQLQVPTAAPCPKGMEIHRRNHRIFCPPACLPTTIAPQPPKGRDTHASLWFVP